MSLGKKLSNKSRTFLRGIWLAQKGLFNTRSFAQSRYSKTGYFRKVRDKVILILKTTWLLPGLSIIEVVLAITILTMTVFVIISLFPYGLAEEKKAEQFTVAANLAQAKIEELISLPYEELTVGTSTEPSLSTIDADFSSFSRTVAIDYLNENLQIVAQDNELKRLKVKINWFDKTQQASSSLSLISLVTNK